MKFCSAHNVFRIDCAGVEMRQDTNLLDMYLRRTIKRQLFALTYRRGVNKSTLCNWSDVQWLTAVVNNEDNRKQLMRLGRMWNRYRQFVIS